MAGRVEKWWGTHERTDPLRTFQDRFEVNAFDTQNLCGECRNDTQRQYEMLKRARDFARERIDCSVVM